MPGIKFSPFTEFFTVIREMTSDFITVFCEMGAEFRAAWRMS